MVPCCSGAVPGGNDAPPSAVKIPHSKMEPSAALAFLSVKEEECDRVSLRCAATWSKRGGSVLLMGVGQATRCSRATSSSSAMGVPSFPCRRAHLLLLQ